MKADDPAPRDRDPLAEALCRPHCVFFKPWKVEEERCGGYEWFARRAWPGAWGLEELEPVGPRTALANDDLVARALCARCAFREADCDFRDPAGPAGAVPCGGALAVDALLSRGALDRRELEAPEG